MLQHALRSEDLWFYHTHYWDDLESGRVCQNDVIESYQLSAC